MANDILNFQKEAGEAQLRLVAENIDVPVSNGVEQQFVNFLFLRVNNDWRRLDVETKRIYKIEFETAFDAFRSDLLLYSYSLVGFDSKADLMFWRIGPSLDVVQEMTASLYRTNLGSFIEITDNYLSITKRTMFVDDDAEDRNRIRAGTAKYNFLYPCSKHRDWLELPPDKRDAMIEANFMVGKKFPNIKIHLTRAFGFTDNEYLISFETDDPKDFLALTDELRESPADNFTVRGMPIYTCRQRTLAECLDALG